ncbi:MAG: TetR/AcrR family transcriptional regulator C-terminal domain-containing protein [Eubacteriales bacterium]|nr:TetR/AcrR family transcriptional regulator C-terminal domain-containing protein [Eubacteriales bacterium]
MKKPEQTVDRRVRKTRKLLLDGLTELMMTKDVSDISVKELSDLVDINRGTFYLHYRDVFDMLNKVEDELFERFNEILDKDFQDVSSHTEPVTSPLPLLKDICNFLIENEKTVRALIGPHGDLAFVNRLKDLVRQHMTHLWDSYSFDVKQSEYYFSFIISGCVGLLETWFNTGLQQTPDELAKLANDLICCSLKFFS